MRTGITLVYYGLVLVLASIVIGVPLAFTALGNPAVLLVVLGLVLIGSLMSLVGKFFCLAVPRESGLAPIIYASVGLEFLSLLMSGTARFNMIPPIAEMGGQVLTYVAAILFIVFLWKLAGYIKRPDLEKTAVGLLVIGALLIAILVFMVVATLMKMDRTSIGISALVLVVFGLWMLMQYGRLLTGLKRALS